MESWKMRRFWGWERKIISRVESHKICCARRKWTGAMRISFSFSRFLFWRVKLIPFVLERWWSWYALTAVKSSRKYLRSYSFPVFRSLRSSPCHHPCNPIHTSPRPLIALRLLPQDALSLALSIVSATPRGPSSLSTTLRCSIYKRSFSKRARFFQPAGDKFLDLAFSLLDGTTFTIALWYCSRVSDHAIMRSARNEKCMFLYRYCRAREK